MTERATEDLKGTGVSGEGVAVLTPPWCQEQLSRQQGAPCSQGFCCCHTKARWGESTCVDLQRFLLAIRNPLNSSMNFRICCMASLK